MGTKKTGRHYSRRKFIQRSASGVAGAVVSGSVLGIDPVSKEVPVSWKLPGGGFSNYGQPGESPGSPIRWISADRSTPGNGVSWTPLHQLEGMITPNGLIEPGQRVDAGVLAALQMPNKGNFRSGYIGSE